MSEAQSPVLNPWQPMTRPIDLAVLGKLGEELGECVSAKERCAIQGIDESDPVTGKPNKEWLEDEIADVTANLAIVSDHFNLDHERILKRALQKLHHLRAWHAMLGGKA